MQLVPRGDRKRWNKNTDRGVSLDKEVRRVRGIKFSNITEYQLCIRHLRGDNNQQDVVLALKEHYQYHKHCLLGESPRNPSSGKFY